MQQEQVNLNRLVANQLQSSRQVFNNKVKVDFMSDEDLENVCADPSQIEQVLTFLLAKANSTMPDGGELILLTRNVKNNPFMLQGGSTSESGSYVMLSVTDTGGGMDDNAIHGILDPCPSAGEHEAGAELSAVNRIVKAYNGEIKVSSEVGDGTTFQIFLPSSGGAKE